jgi:hypothetical protein
VARNVSSLDVAGRQSNLNASDSAAKCQERTAPIHNKLQTMQEVQCLEWSDLTAARVVLLKAVHEMKQSVEF